LRIFRIKEQPGCGIFEKIKIKSDSKNRSILGIFKNFKALLGFMKDPVVI
jgi:hypothetical protein